jgi:hypothetical protein
MSDEGHDIIVALLHAHAMHMELPEGGAVTEGATKSEQMSI